VNRADFQQLADIRIDEAKTLLDAGKYDGAYYLAGYAVECALKACIAKLTNQHDFPPDRRSVERCYTHDIDMLVDAARLTDERKNAISVDRALEQNWLKVKDWSESSRYMRIDGAAAQALFEAIIEPVHGVLPWLKQRW
jgi:HEPN domain-containing protein